MFISLSVFLICNCCLDPKCPVKTKGWVGGGGGGEVRKVVVREETEP